MFCLSVLSSHQSIVQSLRDDLLLQRELHEARLRRMFVLRTCIAPGDRHLHLRPSLSLDLDGGTSRGCPSGVYVLSTCPVLPYCVYVVPVRSLMAWLLQCLQAARRFRCLSFPPSRASPDLPTASAKGKESSLKKLELRNRKEFPCGRNRTFIGGH